VPSIGAPELLVIIVLALIIFGPRRLPEIGRTVGKGMREFRRAASEIRGELEQDLDEEPPPVRRARSRAAPKREGAAPAGDGGSAGEPTTGDHTSS
jgi:sec-independent protein translocase protein TatA